MEGTVAPKDLNVKKLLESVIDFAEVIGNVQSFNNVAMTLTESLISAKTHNEKQVIAKQILDVLIKNKEAIDLLGINIQTFDMENPAFVK